MRIAGIIFLFFLLPPFVPSVFSQQGNTLDSLIARADSFYVIKNYDSSLACNLKAIKWFKENKPDNYQLIQAASILLNTGKCYLKQQDVEHAHQFMYYSLKHARANRLNVDAFNALTELNKLHKYISDNNLDFNYPSISATEEISMFYPVTKVETVSADSIRIIIQAGRYDGITDSVWQGAIISKYDGANQSRPFGLVNCYLRQVGNNFSVAMATNDSSLVVKVGDLVELKTRMPIYWRSLDIANSAGTAIGMLDNYKQPLYNTRYLHYYADSLSNKEIAGMIKMQVEEIAEMMKEDSSDYKDLKYHNGIFGGKNLIEAMDKTTAADLRLFLAFVNEYPRKYIGQEYKFSEIYATWIINSTPMALAEVSPLLINQPSSMARQKMAVNLAADIKNNNLIDRWFNEGMQKANADNIDSAQYLAMLIADASTALQDKYNEGWGSYLSAFIEKKLGNYNKADSLFKLSEKQFRVAENKEGERWAFNALANLKKEEKIKVTVQSGHLFPYIIATSPNPRYMATGGIYDKFIKIWDLLLGKEILTFTAHTDDIESLQYSPNGRYLVSASLDSTIKIWNAYDYSLLNTFKTNKPELSVIFTPDSKQLVAGGKDSLIKFLDINTGKVLKTLKLHKASVTGLAFLPTNSDVLFSCGSDSMVYKWDLETNEMDRWYKEKGKVMGVWVSNDGKYMCSLSTDTMMHVWDLEKKKSYFKVKVNASKTVLAGTFAGPSFSPDSKLLAYASANDTLVIVNLATKTQIPYSFKPGEYGLFDVTFSQDGNYLAGRLDMGGPLRIYDFSTWDFNNNSANLNSRDIKTYYSLPLTVQFTRDDNGLVILHDAVSKVDLRNGATSFLFYGALDYQNNYILLNNEDIFIYGGTDKAALKFFDYVKVEQQPKVSLPDSTEKLTRFELSANNKFIFLGGENGTVAAYDFPARKLLFANSYTKGEIKEFSALRYDSLRHKLYAIDKANNIIVIDAINGAVLNSFKANNPATIEVTPACLYVTCANSEVYKYNATSLQLVKKIKLGKGDEECYNSVMSYNYKYLVVQVGDKFITIDTKTDKVLYEKYDHDYFNGMMAISHNNKLLATGGFDSKVNMYDLATGNKVSTIYTPRGKDFMIADSKGNYLAPKSTLEAVSFNYNNNSYGFEQFDARFNRPDLVLKELGRADSNLVQSYYSAYKKRLKKLNITESSLGDDVHLPVVRLKEKFAIRPVTSSSNYELNIECYDAKYPLQSLQVLVNDNPVFGTAGKKIAANTNRTDIKVEIPLSVGVNMIKIYCTNNKGAVSLAENIEIRSSYKPEITPKTYFIGIAVSNYKDSSMNLRFAAKDVRDLAASFGKLFKNYETDTLIDAGATKENILALRNKLMNTTVNDKVIISVNGHGLLSDSLDFYYGTYDIDFKSPTKRGLKYEDLEALLDGIPARKKLLLIDACHSGALDKEELLAQQKMQEQTVGDTINETGSVKGFASRGIIVKKSKAATDANSSYEVMQNLFTDISTGNGAVIISAAGGMEYAFESDKWNNGVFTYCIRKGIEEEQADTDGGNNNRAVEVAELKEYVSRKVSELTNGKQRPVSRRENIDLNWIIW